MSRTNLVAALCLLSSTVACADVLGGIQASITTSGVAPDIDGYRVEVSGPAFFRNVPANVNGKVTIASVPYVGPYTVALANVAANCDVSPATSTVSVAFARRTLVPLLVTCSAPTMLAYAAPMNGLDIFVTMSDGRGSTQITNVAGDDFDPAWSPDGRIAFASQRSGDTEIYVMNADGTNATRLTNSPGADRNPAWSPDGSRIVFVSEGDSVVDLYIMNADGTKAQRLTNTPVAEDDPAWSPDGKRIAFSGKDGPVRIHVMNVDGTGVIKSRSSTSDSETKPAWSPDGSTIAFEQCSGFLGCESRVVTIASNLAGPVAIHGEGTAPTWSPDGRWLAHAGPDCARKEGCDALLAVRVDGAGRTRILLQKALTPSWRW